MRSDERGNTQVDESTVRKIALQWGRVRMNAEMLSLIADRVIRAVLQWGRVRMNAEMVRALKARAVDAKLQWGRVRMNAEIWPPTPPSRR